ncbi:MAG: phosphopeptide-binding protein [Rickettsiales bacterium]|nr:phosphopeptide-binding protein [Rickettsiales bacterium]MAR57300.1 phosphopeptide-binding protein [Rickettsiales bacterium]
MTFRIYKGDELVRTEQLTQEIIKVGVHPSSHLRIDDDTVSRMHAVIEVTGPDEIFIIDLGSASGTIVNGKKVNKTKLESGDEILLGDTKVVVDIGAAGAEDAAPAIAPANGEPVPASAPPAPAAAAAAKAPVPPPNPFAAPAVGTKPAPGGVPNPFAAPVASPTAAAASVDESDPENVQYGIVASGPPVSPDEVESGEQAVEVVIMWGDRQVLHVEHLNPFRPFYVGEPGGKEAPVDFLMGSDVLGTNRMPVVVAGGAGVAVVIPQGATGEVIVGDQVMSIADLRAQGKLQASGEAPGAEIYGLPAGATAKVKHNGFTFVTKQVVAGKKIAGGMSIDWQPLTYVFGSMAVFGILLTMMYFIPPAGGGLNLDLLNTDSRLVQYLMEPPATEEEETPEWMDESDQQDDEGGKGKRHKGEEGAMGKKEAKKTNNRYAIEGPQDNEDPHMAREEAREQARNAGILGTLQAMTGSFNSPTSPFGADTALGNDPMSALGALMGDQIGENAGFGGLGLRGTGRGGGGTGEGTIGLGNLGTIGHGGGGGSGSGYGRGAGGFRGRSARVPQIRSGNADVRGSLSKEVIRRVIRRHINEVKFCYEQQLNQRPDLEGRVTVRFIISPTGAVQNALVQASTLGNQPAESCIAAAVRRWTFPAPDGGGIVIVNYPFMLNAAGG